jgi:hypothetical protein
MTSSAGTRVGPARRNAAPRDLALAALSAGGVAFAVIVLFEWIPISGARLGGGDIATYGQVGRQLLDGTLYSGPALGSFLYAPPLAVVFAILSLLPAQAEHLLLGASEVLALRYIAGSWRGAGLLCWCPLVPVELATANINLLIAATIVAGVHGSGMGPALGALAKFSPAFALDRRGLRAFLLTLAVMGVLTLPWLWLWPAWITHMVGALGVVIGPQIPISLVLRLPVAAVLVATRRPWARALGAVIAIPGFYWLSLVVLVAPWAVYCEGWQQRRHPVRRSPWPSA